MNVTTVNLKCHERALILLRTTLSKNAWIFLGLIILNGSNRCMAQSFEPLLETHASEHVWGVVRGWFNESKVRRPAMYEPPTEKHDKIRWDVLRRMEQVMGPLPGPEMDVSFDVQLDAIESVDGYWRIHLTYAADKVQGKIDRVPAYLLLPKKLAKQAPAMLCLHQTHFELGKGEPCGMGGNPNLHIAHELASRGFVCLAPDYPGFGEYAYSFDHPNSPYASGTMKGIWNHIHAVDLLEAMPCIRSGSIGVIGHSLGGHNALFVAAFDPRLRCVVTSCGFNSFSDYYGGDLTGWSSSRYMPRIATHFDKSPSRMPFDFPDVLIAIAPRPIFVNAPKRDRNFAVVGVEKCEAAVRPIYQSLGAESRLIFRYPDAEHDFPLAIRDEVYAWLEKNL